MAYVKNAGITNYFDEEKYGNMPLSVIVPENNEELSYDNQVKIVEDIINNQFMSFHLLLLINLISTLLLINT